MLQHLTSPVNLFVVVVSVLLYCFFCNYSDLKMSDVFDIDGSVLEGVSVRFRLFFVFLVD